MRCIQPRSTPTVRSNARSYSWVIITVLFPIGRIRIARMCTDHSRVLCLVNAAPCRRDVIGRFYRGRLEIPCCGGQGFATPHRHDCDAVVVGTLVHLSTGIRNIIINKKKTLTLSKNRFRQLYTHYKYIKDKDIS